MQGLADIVKTQCVNLENANGASEVAWLIEEVRSASYYVSSLWINTKNYTAFDRDAIPHFVNSGSTSLNWACSATKKDGGWIVRVRYDGPPASIVSRQSDEIDVNEKQVFRSVRIRE